MSLSLNLHPQVLQQYKSTTRNTKSNHLTNQSTSTATKQNKMIPFSRPPTTHIPSTSLPHTVQPFPIFQRFCDSNIYSSKQLRTLWTSAQQSQNMNEMNRVAVWIQHHYTILNQYRVRILEYTIREHGVDEGVRNQLRRNLWEEYERMGTTMVEAERFLRRCGRFGTV
ncbi:uncharacterized protein EAF01_005554 [Botrytis porri]|uniref:uncharacterized protein n=1 Tax=Botrytis porri TaxID=87229 RepID=UPI001902B3EA|nr:uncharacterized protein EAF01_005554 [Botrytis porri]KAF7905033.1 hypothetical protein EAF01_005554 [Botrytis porri]